MRRSPLPRRLGVLASVLLAAALALVPATAAHADIETIELGFQPWDVALSPDGTYALVADRLGGEVVKVDVATGTVVDSYTVLVPKNIVFSNDGSLAYIGSDVIPARISVLDTATGTVTIAPDTVGGSGSSRLALSPDGSTLLHTSANAELRVIDTATLTIEVTLATGTNPAGIAITPDGTTAYVINNGDATFQTVNLAVTPATISAPFAGNTTSELAITPSGSELYTNYWAALNRITPGSPPTYTTDAVPLAGVGSTRDIVFDPAGSGAIAFVADNTNDVVLAVDLATSTVLESFAVGDGPYMLDHSNVGTTIAVANFSDTSISLIELVEPALTGAPGPAYVSNAFSFVPTTSGFPAPEFSLTAALPAGLTFDPATGAITGTPTQEGTFPVTIGAENLLGTASLSITIVVQPASAAPAALPPTGQDVAATAFPAGIALIAIFAGVLIARRRRETAA